MEKTFENREAILEEIRKKVNDSEYNLYEHKRRKKTLYRILNEYFEDYQIVLRDTYNGNKELCIRIFDAWYTDGEYICESAFIACY